MKLALHLGVERLACHTGVVEVGKIKLGEIFFDHKAVDRGRGAEGRDLVVAHFLTEVLSVEPLIVIDKERRACNPLAIDLAPGAFGPTGIGYRQV